MVGLTALSVEIIRQRPREQRRLSRSPPRGQLPIESPPADHPGTRCDYLGLAASYPAARPTPGDEPMATR